MPPPTTTRPATVCDVRTFLGPGLAGNGARVILGHPAGRLLPENAGALCAVDTLDRGRARVSCTGHGGPIRFCGHGLLAAAAVLLETGERMVLSTAEREVQARRRGKRVWLTLPRVRCHPCAVPAFARHCFNLSPQRAALAGGESDYWILEWPWTTPLTGLEADMQRLCRDTDRAVIALQEDRGPFYHYRLRYFAPQYGMAEDTVTGSAHAVAADYWQRRNPRLSRRRGLQASPGGGLVFSHISAERVSIGGDVEIISRSETEEAH